MTATYEPPKARILPSAALFIGGPLDGLLEVPPADGGPVIMLERQHGLASYWQAECAPSKNSPVMRIEYRWQTFRIDSRDWHFYVDTRMTIEEAFSALVMSYALRKTGDACLKNIEAVR